jgi:hypothetical protein
MILTIFSLNHRFSCVSMPSYFHIFNTWLYQDRAITYISQEREKGRLEIVDSVKSKIVCH